jgi:hypothetical protein
MSAGELDTLRAIVADAVAAAEQRGKVSKLTGDEKKQFALGLVAKVASARGVPADTAAMAGDLIEAALGEPLLAAPKPPTQGLTVGGIVGLLLLVCLPLLGGLACGSMSPGSEYVAAERSAWDAISPEYLAYVQADAKLDAKQKDRRRSLVKAVYDRIEAFEADAKAKDGDK